MQFYRIVNGVTVPLRTPVRIGKRHVIHPTVEQAAQLNPPAYPLADNPMPTDPPQTGCEWRQLGYAVDDGRIVNVWEQVEVELSMADYDAAMEDHLRGEREGRGYTTREPDAYLTSQVPRWASDARDWVAHRDAVMGYALGLINAVRAGQREPPTVDEFVAGLPRITWTYVED